MLNASPINAAAVNGADLQIVVSGAAGLAAGIGAAAGVGVQLVRAVGVAAGLGGASGYSSLTAGAAGLAAGIGAASGAGLQVLASAGAAIGVGAASGSGGAVVAAAGIASGAGNATGMADTIAHSRTLARPSLPYVVAGGAVRRFDLEAESSGTAQAGSVGQGGALNGAGFNTTSLNGAAGAGNVPAPAGGRVFRVAA